MGWLQNKSVYLAGPIEHDPSAANWRDVVTAQLHCMGIVVYDPIKKPEWTGFKGNYHIKEFLDEFNLELNNSLNSRYELNNLLNRQHYDRHVCLRCVRSADIVICRLPKEPTAGTFEELTIASQERKPVFIFGPDGVAFKWTLSLFDYMHPSEFIFNDGNGIIEYLKSIDTGKASIDPLLWIFLSYVNKYPNLILNKGYHV